MGRGPLYQDQYRPQFSGHETFPLRYGWLKKSFDAISATESSDANKTVFSEDAISRFGVGRNMVASMRHWAVAAGILEESPGSSVIRTTALGKKLFGPKGLDPYLEHPASLWLVHWELSSRAEKTTWFWAFNHFPSEMFDREHLTKGLERLANESSWNRAATATIKNDVACFVRTYATQSSLAQSTNEDTLESPLTELGLIKPVGKREGFRFVRGAKPTLGDGVFIYALIDFWYRVSKTATLSFEAIAHEPGSPGRVFLLTENDIADRLSRLEEKTDGVLRWSETAGLKQVVREIELDPIRALKFIRLDYSNTHRRELI